MSFLVAKEEKSSGEAAEDHGTKDTTRKEKEQSTFEEINVEDLLAAAAAAEQR